MGKRILIACAKLVAIKNIVWQKANRFQMDRTQRIMAVALTVSVFAHIAFILMVGFSSPKPKKITSSEPLEIVLVNQKTETAPARPDVLAQVNMDGGGNTDGQHRAKSPLPAAQEQQEIQLEQAVQQQKQLEEQAQKMMSQLKAKNAIPTSVEAARQQLEKNNKGVDPEQLKKQAAELAANAAQISKDYNEYQSKPRKTYLGVRAKQTSVAYWADSWQQKVESVGTRAYPVDSHGQKLYGRMRVTVEINTDGSIISKSIETSSGNADLDRAALHVLELAAPFSRLPADMLDETGKPATVLVITRTWTFGKRDGLGIE